MSQLYYRYFCKKLQRDLTKEDIQLHDCYHHNKPKKGKHKGIGKRCFSLIRIPVNQGQGK